MPFVPQGSSFADYLADMDRRLRNLEATARSGLSRIAFDFQDEGLVVSTYDTWFMTNGTVTLPSVTLVTGQRVIVQVGTLVSRFGNQEDLASLWGLFGFGVDGLNPEEVPFGSNPQRIFFFDSPQVYVPLAFAVLIDEGMGSGEHVFQVWAKAEERAAPGATDAIFDDSWIMVIPLDVP